MSKVSTTFTIDVRIASYISEHFSDTREASAFVNKVLLDYINQQTLTPEKIDAMLQENKDEYDRKQHELIEKKRSLLNV